MFSTNEYVLAAEAAYRREQLIASLPVRRASRARWARAHRISTRILGRHATPAKAAPAAHSTGVACAA